MLDFERFDSIFGSLSRAVDDQIFFTYEDGRSALASLDMNGKEIDGVPMRVTLKSSEAMSKTDPSINALISMGNDSDNETDEHGFTLTDLLSHSRRNTRSNSILLPEKMIEQADYLDDDDTRSVDDVLDDDSDSDEIVEGDSQEILLKRQQEMVDSDEEEEGVNTDVPSQKILPGRPSNPPQRPTKPPQRPSTPPKRPAAPVKPPRPSASRPDSVLKKGTDRVITEKEIPLKSQASFTEFDPLQNSMEKAKPSRPSRPKQGPAKPPPPRTAVKGNETEDILDKKGESVKKSDEVVSDKIF